MNLLSRNKYLALLVALLLLLVVYPLLRGTGGSPVLYDLLLSAVFIAALAIVFPGAKFRSLALVLGIPTVLGIWVGYALPGIPRRPLSIAFHMAAILFLILTVGAILRRVYNEAITSESVYGGFCGYILTGLAFGHVYCLVETFTPGSFNLSGSLADRLQPGQEQHFLLSYFSLTTITTAGFGDVTPASDVARSFAMAEAIVGQFYIAVLVAELIGKKLSSPARSTEGSERGAG